MTKRLIDAAQAVTNYITPCGNTHIAPLVISLQAAIDEARQPVTVTQDQAFELDIAICQAIGEEFTQAERDAMPAEDVQMMRAAFTAILRKAKELGL